MLTDSTSVIAAPTDTDEPIFLSTGGTERRGTVIHIGDGLYIGHNHGRHGTYTDKAKTITFGRGLDGEQKVVRNAHYHFTQDDHLENPGVRGGGQDIALYVSDTPNDLIPSVPLLILSDPSDLVGERAITTRMASPGTTHEGSVHYSTGSITFANEGRVVFSNNVVGGMSGSGIFVQVDTDGDGQIEDYTIGVVTRYGSGESWAGQTYTDLAETLEAIAFDPGGLPRYTLMSGFDQNSASHEVNGTYLNENIIGGTWNDILFGNGGDDTFTGGAGHDTFVISSDDGHDVITDFSAAEDSIDVTQVVIPDFVFTQMGNDVFVMYDNGNSSILFQNTTLTDIQAEFPAYNIIHGTDASRELFFGTDANDIIYGHGGKDIFHAGENLGADIYIGGEGVNFVSYTSSDVGVILDLENNIGRGGSAEGDRWFAMQSIQTSNQDDIVYGSSEADTVWLHQGNDQFFGQGGDDLIRLTSGTDYVDGGAGYDSVSFKQGSGHKIDVFAAGDLRKTADMNTYTSIEEVIAHKESDVITIGSGTGVEVINASAGDDVLNIMANTGLFWGGSGADDFNIQPDNLMSTQTMLSIADFDASSDSLSVLGRSLDLTRPGTPPAGFSYDNNASGDLVIRFGDDDMITLHGVDASALEGGEPIPNGVFDGTSGKDRIVVGSTDFQGDVVDHSGTTIYGNEGDDFISGGDGGDEIFGGEGDDIIYGRKGWDIIHGGSGNDTISGDKGLNTLYGDAGNDVIYSGVHASKLFGGAGDDTLVADFKKNAHHTLAGGNGADNFVFNLGSTSAASKATITDFELNNDRLIINGTEVDLLAPGAEIEVTPRNDGILIEFNDNEWVLLEGVFDLI